MRKLLIAIFMAFSLLTMTVTSASAARLGKGGSFGRMSPNIGRQAPLTSPTQRTNSTTEPRQGNSYNQNGAMVQRRSAFGGLLGGALMGLGLGYLFSNMGLGAEASNTISTILLFVLIFIGIRLLMRWMTNRRLQHQDKRPLSRNYQEFSALDNERPEAPEIGSGIYNNTTQNSTSAWGIPADFDTAAFLRAAKSHFIRLQAAWDKGDINDLHYFTTPEMFAELRMQLQERGNATNITDVIELHADLLGIETTNTDYLASVRFTGKIRETQNGPVESFHEIWNMSRPLSKASGWVLAGIQQS